MPALQLTYTRPILHDELLSLDPERSAGLPATARSNGAQWVDLDGEGLPGVLTAEDGGWYYRPNLGGGLLAPAVLQRSLPNPGILGASAQLVDLDGDGQLELARYAPPPPGAFTRTAPHEWGAFTPFHQLPILDWNDPNLRLIDLDGDGLPDLLITEHDALVWHRSHGKGGFSNATRLPQHKDELEGPSLVFADGTETIHLTDLSGDGLVDLVRVRNHEVCYWPNLGHGRFGGKVTLDNSPTFDGPELFDPTRVRFADLDGSGPSDLIYLGRDGLQIYFNQSGNSLSALLRVRSLPAVDVLSSISILDLLGHGTACLVWTSTVGDTQELRYVDLLGGRKPYLLESMVNNLGGETRLAYAPSTRFYLEDQAAGRPWLTRLPFPVHVIERVEYFDHVMRSKLVTRYRYRHGFYDGREREFGGFACVEQWDAESFGGERGRGLFPELPYDVDPQDPSLNLPPVRTITWFHTGAWLDREQLALALQLEYYAGDPDAPVLPDTALPGGLSVAEEHEAARALRGSILRREIYAEDGTSEHVHPYSVAEGNSHIRVLQRRLGNRNAVFSVHQGESLAMHYERRAEDPRVQHQLVLEVDDFGNVLQSAALAYPRRSPQHPEQAALWVTCAEASFLNRDAHSDWYRVGVPLQSTQRELTGLTVPPSQLVSASQLRAAIAAAVEIPFEAVATPGVLARRVLQGQRIRYLRDDLSGPLPFGEVESLALVHESYAQIFTPGLLSQAFGARVSEADLRDLGRYVWMENAWWAPSGRVVVDPSRFYLPVEAIDAFGQRYRARYDAHALLLLDIEDPLHNRSTVGLRDATGTIIQNGYDYRTLTPVLFTDPNRNRTAVALDVLGMVVKTAVLGKEGAGEGDTLDDPTTTIEYDLHRWRSSGGTQPACQEGGLVIAVEAAKLIAVIHRSSTPRSC